MTFNGRTVVSNLPYVAIAQSKVEHQVLLTKNFMLRMAAMRAGGNPILSSQKVTATSSNFISILPQLPHGSTHLDKPVVRAKPHLFQNIHCAIHSAIATPKP